MSNRRKIGTPRRWQQWVVVLLLYAIALWHPAAALAQPLAIDVEKSVMTVRVSKAGFLSALGHDHEIVAPITRGTVDTAARQVDLYAKAGALQVRDRKASENDRSQVQYTMLGPEVLDAQRYTEIAFRSTNADLTAAGFWKVSGILTLHGQTRPIGVDVQETGGHYVGHFNFKQTDFGIKPVKAAGGSIQVKDEVRIEFDIQLAR